MKTLLTIIIALACLYTTAQSKKQKQIIDTRPEFNGIGIFKIGIDTSDIVKMAKDSNMFIRDVYDFDTYYQAKENHFRELMRLKKTPGSYLTAVTTYCPDVDEYLIGKCIISNIEITAVVLKFYKGKLIEFTCNDGDDLINAMKQKYGDPIIKETHRKIDCLYNLSGITSSLITDNFIVSWNGMADISVIEGINKNYDSHCEPLHFSYFTYSIRVKAIEDWDNSHSPNGIGKGKKDLAKF